MKHKWTRLLLIGIAIVSLTLSACGGGGGSNNGPSLNSDPVPHAGSNQNVTTGSIVTLDGSGSHDPDGDLLTFLWTITSNPIGSAATLSNPSAVNPTFVADYDGEYVLHLTVDDGEMSVLSEPVTITASTTNSAPVANAGPDQNVTTGTLVTLNGGASTDANNDPLTYSWIFTSMPPASSAVLSSSTVSQPTFLADTDGRYTLSLIVNDGTVNSAADTVTITATTANSAPVANAGPNQYVAPGSLITLDGSGSSDADGDSLTFQWAFTSIPTGSSTTLVDPESATPTFTADIEGDYVIRLIVSDGKVNSDPDTVNITCDSSIIPSSGSAFYIQSRSYEYQPYSNRVSLYASLRSDLIFEDIQSIFILDANENSILSKSDLIEFDDELNQYRCDIDGCSFRTLKDFYYFKSIENGLLPGDYTFRLQTNQGEVITQKVYYPGKVVIPHIDSNTVSAEWGSDESLSIAWQNPALEWNWNQVDIIRINIFSSHKRDVYLTITVPKDTTAITVPSEVITQTFNEIEQTELRIVHHTRAHDENGHNYSRAFSSGVTLSKPSAELEENIVYTFSALPSQTLMYKFVPNLESYYEIFLTNTSSNMSWALSTTTNIEDSFLYCDDSYLPVNEICTTAEKLIKGKDYYIFVEELDYIPGNFSLTIMPTIY